MNIYRDRSERAADLPVRLSSAARFRLDVHPVIDCVAEFLFASEVDLRGLDGDVPEQELDLIEFATCEVAQPRARAPKLNTERVFYVCARRGLPDNLPQHFGEPISLRSTDSPSVVAKERVIGTENREPAPARVVIAPPRQRGTMVGRPDLIIRVKRPS